VCYVLKDAIDFCIVLNDCVILHCVEFVICKLLSIVTLLYIHPYSALVGIDSAECQHVKTSELALEGFFGCDA